MPMRETVMPVHPQIYGLCVIKRCECGRYNSWAAYPSRDADMVTSLKASHDKGKYSQGRMPRNDF